jgi:hypothetical protein
MKSTCSTFLILIGLILFEQSQLHGSHPDKTKSIRLIGLEGLPDRTKSNINRISAWYDSDGAQEYNSPTGNSGLVFPRGTATAIFKSGLMWGGISNDGTSPALRISGQNYNLGTAPGAILGFRTGLVEDPEAPDVRIWRVRRDFDYADLAQDAAEIYEVSLSDVTQSQIDVVRDQYLTDWLEWPAHKGAPFYDSNADGIYTPAVVEGASHPISRC